MRTTQPDRGDSTNSLSLCAISPASINNTAILVPFRISSTTRSLDQQIAPVYLLDCLLCLEYILPAAVANVGKLVQVGECAVQFETPLQDRGAVMLCLLVGVVVKA